jgi:hypothetical protein
MDEKKSLKFYLFFIIIIIGNRYRGYDLLGAFRKVERGVWQRNPTQGSLVHGKTYSTMQSLNVARPIATSVVAVGHA